MIAGLTGAIPIYNAVQSGLTTSNATTNDTDSNLQTRNLQIRYQPSGLGMDLASSLWDVVSIDDGSVFTPLWQYSDPAVNLITGENNSSMEAGVWEELLNTQSVSTTRSIQAAIQNGISIATLTMGNTQGGDTNQITNLLNIDPGYGLQSAVSNSISGFLKLSDSYWDYRVVVPTRVTPIGESASDEWIGVGYLVQRSVKNLNTWAPYSFIIQGYTIVGGVAQPLQAPHGGEPVAPPDSSVDIATTTTQSYVGDPINIANGDVTHDETDINIPSVGIPLSFGRHYSSLDTVAEGQTSTSDRGLGDGWSFTYSDTLTPSSGDPTGTMVWFTDKGIRLKFLLNGGVYQTPASIFGTLVFNGTGNGYTWTDKTGTTILFADTGPAKGQMLAMYDRYGNGVTIAHDSSGHITIVSDRMTPSRTLTFAYMANHISSITDFTGRVWLYFYDQTTGELATVKAPTDSITLSAVSKYGYYTDLVRHDLLESVTNADGDQTQYSYYVNRRGFQVIDAVGDTHTVSDNLFTNRISFTDERGLVSYYSFDAQGNETLQINPDGTTLASTWENGLKTSSTDALGNTTTYKYDSNGNAIKVIDALGHAIDYAYTDYSNISSITREADNAKTSYYYFIDASGKYSSLKQIVDAIGDVTSYTYPSYPAVNRGRPASMTTPVGNASTDPSDYVTTYGYNNAGQLTSQVSPVAPGVTITISFSYDSRGNLLSSTDGNGNVTTYTYDLLGHRLSETLPDPDGNGGPLPAPHLVYTNDPMGNLLSTTITTDTPQRTTEIVLDQMQRVVRTINADGTYATRSYDPAGNLVLSTDELGQTTQYVYDSRNRVVETIRPDGTVVSTDYDGAGNVVSVTDPLGHTTYYRYDALNRLVGVTDALGFYSGDPFHTTVTTYNALGQISKVTDPLGRATSYLYDILGRRTEMIQPDPDDNTSIGGTNGPLTSPITYYGYDANGNLKFVTDPRGSGPGDPQYTTWYFYDAMNRQVLVIDPLGEDFQLNSIPNVAPTPQPAHSVLTTYDAVGNVIAVTDELFRTTNYTYDNLGRKTAEIDPDPGTGRPTTRYAYDANGNLVSTTDPLGHTTTTAYDLLNRVTKTTDALNNTTISVFSAVGNLLSVTDPDNNKTSYTFDVLGRVTTETDALGHTTLFVYDAAGNLRQETDRDGRVTRYYLCPAELWSQLLPN
jgi:YD repeat-containing protein